VTVITMGPPQAEEALRETVSMGVDEVKLISDRAFGRVRYMGNVVYSFEGD